MASKVEYAPGMRVIIRDEEWVIKKVERNTLGNQTLHVQGISTLVKGRESIFITNLEDCIEIVDPVDTKFVVDTSPSFRKSRLFIESQWRQKIPTDNALHIGYDAAMDTMPYQLEPAQLSLKSPRQRILIADSTGLGKTLEAGILISELIARGKGKRILVVTVKSMMQQFQKEMWNRFTIPLVRLDSDKIQRIRSQIPSNYNPFAYYDKTIVSIDTLKRDIEYRTHLENAYWDIIVIDEAQNVAARGNKTAQRSRLAKLLSGRSDTLIMLSATPHDGRSESFASLMNMLDPTAIADPTNYTKDDIKGLCIRRFKKDVKSQALSDTFKDAVVKNERSMASQEEETAFNILSELELEMDKGAKKGTGQLFKTLLMKSVFSSPIACMKTVEERIRKLQKKYGSDGSRDIVLLNTFHSALEKIRPSSFTRYTSLLKLLNSADYGWNPKDTSDRVVIFTERIETMRFIAENLRKDLNLSTNAIREIYGGMTDKEQQEIVDEFGRTDSPIRVLVGSDVVSEGINLHYLSHRMIHFDIPWSLMVFQQRNGRIDRYGQTKTPDIRYLVVDSVNPKIHGDVRILEILIKKEEQAYKNIGDPALLMGKFTISEEEQVTAGAMEEGTSAEEFETTLDITNDEFDPFEEMMKLSDSIITEKKKDITLYSDLDYLCNAIELFSEKEKYEIHPLIGVEGVDLKVTTEMSKRMRKILPEDVISEGEHIYLSPDKKYCMNEVRRSLQKNIVESSWSKVHYLWKLHPIFTWINDKASLLFGRGEAPVIGIPDILKPGETLFLMSGSIPNRKSTPLVDEWFGIRIFEDDISKLSVEDVLNKAGYWKEIPNMTKITETDLKSVKELCNIAVARSYNEMNIAFRNYHDEASKQIDDEISKLKTLRTLHKQHMYQITLTGESVKNKKEKEIDRLFDNFTNWVSDTMTIENVPYVRVIAVFRGVI